VAVAAEAASTMQAASTMEAASVMQALIMVAIVAEPTCVGASAQPP